MADIIEMTKAVIYNLRALRCRARHAEAMGRHRKVDTKRFISVQINDEPKK